MPGSDEDDPDPDEDEFWKDRETKRVTVDLSKERYIEFQDSLKNVNEMRPKGADKVPKTQVVRGLIGSWARGELPESADNFWE